MTIREFYLRKWVDALKEGNWQTKNGMHMVLLDLPSVKFRHLIESF